MQDIDYNMIAEASTDKQGQRGIKQSAAEIIVDQLEYIKEIKADKRAKWHAKFALDCYKAVEEEQWHNDIVDLSKVPTKDLQQIYNEQKRLESAEE